MKKRSMVVMALALALSGASAAACGMDGHGGCPLRVEGAKVNVVKMETGVVIHVTGGDAATVAKIQASADKTAAAPAGKAGCCAGHGAKAAGKSCSGHGAKPAGKTASAKAGTYSCSMGDYAGAMTADGRCPKCGMALTLKK